MAKIDENKEYMTLAYDGTNIVPLKVDPITNRLLVEIVASSDAAYGARSKIDENKTNVALASDSNDEVQPLLVDSTNGYLYIDMIVG